MTPVQLSLIVFALSNHLVPDWERNHLLAAVRDGDLDHEEAETALDRLLQYPYKG